jgi:hypothetical protein
MVGLAASGQNDIDYQNKRLIGNLKKNGISDFAQLHEIKVVQKSFPDIQGKFFSIENTNRGDAVKFVYVGRVNSCRVGGCCNTSNIEANVESEYFDYFILFDSSKTVRLVDVYNYEATHGYEITAKGWLKQFIGFSGKDTLLVNKEIDGISGATISVFAITEDVQVKTKLLKSID